ncbi:MAG: hypothetical protein MJE66_08760 [Proteobacteria bacterium]|nr:hypothetical protein [Pseudomonadota bacterium]
MNQAPDRTTQRTGSPSEAPRSSYSRPEFEVISLDCEISSYAPDGEDVPLF